MAMDANPYITMETLLDISTVQGYRLGKEGTAAHPFGVWNIKLW